MNRKGFVMSWKDLFKGFFIGLIVGGLLVAAVGYYMFYGGAQTQPEDGEQNTQPSGFSEEAPLDNGMDGVEPAALPVPELEPVFSLPTGA